MQIIAPAYRGKFISDVYKRGKGAVDNEAGGIEFACETGGDSASERPAKKVF